MTKILITGGLGYLGARIANQLSKNKLNKLFISTRKKNHNYINSSNCEIINTNLSNKTELDKILKNVDIVIHSAAMNHDDCDKYLDEATEFNINFTRILYEKSIRFSS